MERKREYGARHGEMTPAVIEAAAGRDATWRAAFVELLAEQYWWGEHLAWPVCHALVRLDGDAPLSAAYLRCFVRQVSAVGADGSWTRTTASSWPRTCGHPDWIGREFWALFRVEGMGADYQLVERTGPAWDAAVLALCRKSRRSASGCWSSRGKRCCEIFQRRASPVLRMHRRPIRPRTRSSPASTRISPCWPRRPAAGHGAVGLLDADAMIDAGAAVLTRAEKKLVKAQLGLFAALRTDAGSATAFRGSSARRWKACRWTSRRWRASWWTRRTRRSGPPRMARWARGKRGGPGSHDTAAASRTVAGSARLRSPSSMTRNCMP